MQRMRIVRVIVTSVVCTMLFIGVIIADCYDAIPGILSTKPLANPLVEIERQQSRTSPPLLRPIAYAPINAHEAEDRIHNFLQADAIRGISDKKIAVAIADSHGQTVASHNLHTALTPASTLKTLTAIAANTTLPMRSRLATSTFIDMDSVRAVSSHKLKIPTVVLSGEGDMLLGAGASNPNVVNGHAGMGTLAEMTAIRLKSMQITDINLQISDTRFGEHRLPPDVTQISDVSSYITPLADIAVHEGIQWPQGQAPIGDALSHDYPPRTQNPARDAGQLLKKLLEKNGIHVHDVSNSTVERSAISDTSQYTMLSTVKSARLYEILAYALQHSDNTLMELFGRLVALETHAPNDPQGAVEAVRNALVKQGITLDNVTMTDCSGLSPTNRVPANVLLQAQELYMAHRGMVAAELGLPVSGLSGTALEREFAHDYAGQFHIKTGTLGDVSTMAGNIVRNNGGVLSFVVMVNDVQDLNAVKHAIDMFVNTLPTL